MPRLSQGEIELSVYGADKLARLAAKLKALGEGELRKRMLAELRKAGRELRDAEREAALGLPAGKYETGLRQAIAAAMVVRTRTAGSSAGVRVMVDRNKLPADKRRLPILMNRGTWRHPVYGDREVWVSQRSQPGWWDEPGQRLNPVLRQRMINVLDRVAAEIKL
jgi:hypothetical protein